MSQISHEGHRKRARQDFLENGFNKNTPPEKVLELLLFYCIGRRDTAPTARKMLAKYGSIPAVLRAASMELAEFDYMSENGAVLLNLIDYISNTYYSDTAELAPRFTNLDEIDDFVAKKLLNLTEEHAGALLMDHYANIISFEIIGSGDVGSVGISMRGLMKLCLDTNATAVVLAHNHPSGVALPSTLDTSATEKVAQTLAHAGVQLIDHVIVGKNDFVSMAQSAEYSHVFKSITTRTTT